MSNQVSKREVIRSLREFDFPIANYNNVFYTKGENQCTCIDFRKSKFYRFSLKFVNNTCFPSLVKVWIKNT